MAAEARQDLDAIMPFYAESAVIHAEGVPAIQGDAAIRSLYQQLFPTVAAFDATITDVTVAASGDLAYETGVNHFVFRRNGDRVPATGKYLAVWRRPEGGQWQITALAVTNNPPQP